MRDDFSRFHHLRKNQILRDTLAEYSLSPEDFIVPVFALKGRNIKEPIAGFHDVYHYSPDRLPAVIEQLLKKGLDKVLLFGVPDSGEKTEDGSMAWKDDNITSGTVMELKSRFPELTLFTDVCLCGYTTHGHCGLIKNGEIDNDRTIDILSRIAVSHGRAGADYVAPSAMMDGQVKAIADGLKKHQLATRIMGYSAKFASHFYGPFRNALDSAPSFGDRRTYQLDFRVKSQAIDEACADLLEGADILMVKPAHAYLDIIAALRTRLPDQQLAAYHVSGEYMMLILAAHQNLVNEMDAFTEVYTGIKRAGADLIISYYADKLF